MCSENKRSRFTTINLGTDTSLEGRMVIQNILKCIKEGIGECRETATPIITFKVKKGINYDEKDKNNDLFKFACDLVKEEKNIQFSYLDAPFNSQMYKLGDFGTEATYLNNGSRIIENIVDEEKETAEGRGILSTTTINLPRIALKHKDNIEEFLMI